MQCIGYTQRGSSMEVITKTAYMIRRNSDGLFSTGGMDPRFSKNGKAWSNFGHLRNHLHQFHGYRGEFLKGFPYVDCSIVILKSVTTVESLGIKESNVEALVAQMAEEADRRNR